MLSPGGNEGPALLLGMLRVLREPKERRRGSRAKCCSKEQMAPGSPELGVCLPTPGCQAPQQRCSPREGTRRIGIGGVVFCEHVCEQVNFHESILCSCVTCVCVCVWLGCVGRPTPLKSPWLFWAQVAWDLFPCPWT